MKNINFLSTATSEEKEVAENLLQSIDFSADYNFVTHFLTNYEQIILEKIIAYNYNNFKIEFYGGNDTCERKKAKIIANDYYDVDYGIVCLKATYNNKFNKIEHRNVLGTVHNLGINFNRVGDIVVTDGEVYIFVDEDIADFVRMELTRIGRTKLEFRETSLEKIVFEKNYDDFEIVSSSFRIDSIVSKITNKSRSKVKEFFNQEFIKLNHVIVKNYEKTCDVGDIISIRKYGRFVIKESVQNKKSLKYRITISKLI